MQKTVFALLALLALSILVGCASASKDIFFRSRLPTMEAPVFNENNRFGLEFDLESDRFQTRITRNLTSDFSFYRDGADFHNSYGRATLEGRDLSVTGAHWFQNLPVQLGLSFDFLEFKMGLYGFQPNQNSGFFAMIDGGIYKTATFEEEDNGCKFICFSSQKDKDNADMQNAGIGTDHGGNEKKYGVQFGYYFDSENAVYAGYHRMDYYYRASAVQHNPPNGSLSFQESFSGQGIGLGYYHAWGPSFATTFAGEGMTINWVSDIKYQMLYSLKLIVRNL